MFYTIIETPTGLEIAPQSDLLRPVVISVGSLALTAIQTATKASQTFGLYDLSKLADRIAHMMTVHHRPLEEWDPELFDVDSLVRALRIALRHDLVSRRDHLLRQVDPHVLAVQRAVYKLIRRAPSLLQNPALYEDREYLHILCSSRAAAYALLLFDGEGWEWQDSIWKSTFEESGTTGELEPLSTVRNWPALYSPTGLAYGHLLATLEHLPRIPPYLLPGFRYIVFERPLTDRLELIWRLAYGTILDTNSPDRRRPRALYAGADEIRAAMRRYTAYTDYIMHNPSHPWNVLEFVSFLERYSQESQRSFLSDRTTRSIAEDWKRSAARRGALIQKLGGDWPTALPPIALPSSPGVRFLTSVGEIVTACEAIGDQIDRFDEPEIMQYSLVWEANDAAWGKCFMFQVTYVDRQAIVSIRPRYTETREVRRGRSEPAPRWAEPMLDSWARRLRYAAARRYPSTWALPAEDSVLPDDELPF
jgi:hypothetical protein